MQVRAAMKGGKGMIPAKFQDYFFNENDYLPENYHCDDPEKEKLIKKLIAMVTDDMDLPC